MANLRAVTSNAIREVNEPGYGFIATENSLWKLAMLLKVFMYRVVNNNVMPVLVNLDGKWYEKRRKVASNFHRIGVHKTKKNQTMEMLWRA